MLFKFFKTLTWKVNENIVEKKGNACNPHFLRFNNVMYCLRYKSLTESVICKLQATCTSIWVSSKFWH